MDDDITEPLVYSGSDDSGDESSEISSFQRTIKSTQNSQPLPQSMDDTTSKPDEEDDGDDDEDGSI